MRNFDAKAFIDSLRNALKNESARNLAFSHSITSITFPDRLKEVAATLEELGLEKRQIQLVILSLCGVSFKPVDPLSLLPDAEPVVLRPSLEQAFLAGFLASGEDWNGEYPHNGNKARAWEGGVEAEYKRWLSTMRWLFERDLDGRK